MITFFAHGDPQTQGSKRAFVSKSGRAVVAESGGESHKVWRGLVADAAMNATTGIAFLDEQVGVVLKFHFTRPKNHYRTGKHAQTLRDDAPAAELCAKRRDVDKLTRAVLDSLTGVVYVDDAQVCQVMASRHWCCRFEERAGVFVMVESLSGVLTAAAACTTNESKS